MTLSLEKSRPKVYQAIVDCFTKNTYFMEFKMYLIIEVFYQLNYEHVDQVLNSYENNIKEESQDGSSYYLLCNLNPIKTVSNVLYLASLIENRYPISELRT